MSRGNIALTDPYVPTGMKAGVSIVPRGNVICPRRAAPVGLADLKFHDSVLCGKRRVRYLSHDHRAAPQRPGGQISIASP